MTFRLVTGRGPPNPGKQRADTKDVYDRCNRSVYSSAGTGPIQDSRNHRAIYGNEGAECQAASARRGAEMRKARTGGRRISTCGVVSVFFRLPLLIGDLLVRSFGRCFVGGQVAARSRSSVTHQKKRIRSFNDIVRYLTDKGEGRAANRPTDGLPFDFLFIGPRGPCHRRPAIH